MRAAGPPTRRCFPLDLRNFFFAIRKPIRGEGYRQNRSEEKGRNEPCEKKFQVVSYRFVRHVSRMWSAGAPLASVQSAEQIATRKGTAISASDGTRWKFLDAPCYLFFSLDKRSRANLSSPRLG
jgi:hypothetical protein